MGEELQPGDPRRIGPYRLIRQLGSGGMGRVFMGALASVVLALLQSYSVLVISSRWQNLLLYGFLFVAIVLFPRGIHLPKFRWRARATQAASVGGV